jgi:hypothetical protein
MYSPGWHGHTPNWESSTKEQLDEMGKMEKREAGSA